MSTQSEAANPEVNEVYEQLLEKTEQALIEIATLYDSAHRGDAQTYAALQALFRVICGIVPMSVADKIDELTKAVQDQSGSKRPPEKIVRFFSKPDNSLVCVRWNYGEPVVSVCTGLKEGEWANVKQLDTSSDSAPAAAAKTKFDSVCNRLKESGYKEI
ncbi:hypothetical protein [Chitinibacter tainanensis]|uniref:hypothetical protein n=1 Tax=Chitinibacter tainanensis TaxID=230667 RepID=UPI000421C2FC|nr:hypothetical protein [Chitinibacter tainanensis]